jgi:Asp-tRNA(Asn)/Glu-tRNA(Gln) amidotransferase A subunit family amidase
MSELMDLSGTELAALVRARKVSAEEATSCALDRIEERNGTTNAFVLVCSERALDEARAVDRRLAAGDEVGPLAGVPFGVKDLEDVGGLPTTYGSVPFRDHVPDRDSVEVSRLRAAGAIVVGKTNTPEFGYTAFTDNRLFGTTRNPWNTQRTPGGSSGGSSAAIASRLVPFATASDGGGSVRIPACYVGAFGMKPTFGRIPVGPEEALGMQRWVDTVCYGPITRDVRDAALFLDVASGYHPTDPNSLPAPTKPYRAALDEPLGKLKIGFSRDFGYAVVEPGVLREVESAVDVFRSLGHEVVDLDLKLPDLGFAWAYMCGAEDYAHLANHPRVRDSKDELCRGYWRGLQAASSLTHEKTAEFQHQRAQLNYALADLFSEFDLLLSPMLPTEAFNATGPFPKEIAGKTLENPIHVVAFTYPFNLSGHPAASVRAGFGDAGLPVGMQIVAERHRDDLVLQASAAYDRERPMKEWPDFDG